MLKLGRWCWFRVWAFASAFAVVAVPPGLAQLEGGGEGSTNSAPPAERFAISPGGVDMRTGRYAYKATDLAIGAGQPGDLALTRTLVTPIAGYVHPFANFSHEWNIMLTEKRIHIFGGSFQHGTGNDYEMSIRYGGRSDTFRGIAAYAWFDQVAMNPYARLTYSGDRNGPSVVYTYQATDGTVVTFRPLGGGDCTHALRCAYPSEIVEPDGIRYSFEYSGSKLRSVVSSRGYALLLEWGSFITKACVLNLAYAPKPANNACPANAPQTTTYSYADFEGAPRLSAATDAAGNAATFAYARVGGVPKVAFTKPGQPAPWLTNSVSYWPNEEGAYDEAVDRQDFADGSHFLYYYDQAPEAFGQAGRIAGGRYGDAQGNWTYVTYDFPVRPGTQNPGAPISYGMIDYQITPGPAAIVDTLGRTTANDYCDPTTWAGMPPGQPRCLVSMLQSTVDPEGGKTIYTYDGFWTRNVTQVRRKAKPGSGLADIVTSATYDCTHAILCARPASTTDARGNVTDYAYDPAHGGMLARSLPADAAGVRPVTRYAYAQRHAWLSDGAGGHVQAAAPIWVLAEERTCRTTATVGNACAGGPSDEAVTVYDYGPDGGPGNLLLRGIVADATGLALRTCYAYDRLGNRIRETAPRAGLASCP